MRGLLIPVALLSLAGSAHADYQPAAELVVDNVYAIVGPLGQRSADNDGLNASFGFVVTDEGVILIDTGASRRGAEKLAAAIRAVTEKPVRWVINTGSQDHRWLGNDYFAGQGAEVIAMARTAVTQGQYAQQLMAGLEPFLGERLRGTRPLPATRTLGDESARLELGGEVLELAYTDAHFPGDAWVWLPERRVIFSGDLVYVDRLLSLLPQSSVHNAQRAFRALEQLNPEHIVPGHGRACDLGLARRESGDYYDFLADTVGEAARQMEPMDEILDRYADLPQFNHLENYDALHRANMNRAFLESEAR
jgi:glyoxylase-like metal-dependent hydrolase (beta-lactamase superfamily II)